MTQLAVNYDIGSAAPVEIWRAARGLCDLVFLVDLNEPEPSGMAELLGEFGDVITTTHLSVGEVAEELRRRAVSGVTTFSEFRLSETARLAELLRLPYHSAETVRRLTDKPQQRHALRVRGVDALRYRVLDGPDAVSASLEEIDLPAVLKPAVGAASKHTYRVDTVTEGMALAEYLFGQCGYGRHNPLVLEELLIGDPAVAGVGWGDYVSVESVASDGAIQHFAVLGKLPLAEPFRETGMFVPATIPSDVVDRVLALTSNALKALGVDHGITQTEVKLTPEGPRVIEVNGRLGGYVADIVRRAGGTDPVRLALQVALRQPLPVLEQAGDSVVFQYFLPAPTRRIRVTDTGDSSAVRRLAGVERIGLQVVAGDVVDWRDGTRSYLGVISGRVASHDDLAKLVSEVDQRNLVHFEPIECEHDS